MWTRNRLLFVIFFALVVRDKCNGSTFSAECNGNCENDTIPVEILTLSISEISLDDEVPVEGGPILENTSPEENGNPTQTMISTAANEVRSTPQVSTSTANQIATSTLELQKSTIAKGMLGGHEIGNNLVAQETNVSNCFRTACCNIFVSKSSFNVDTSGLLRLSSSNETFTKYILNDTGAVVCFPNSEVFIKCPKWLLEIEEVHISPNNLSLIQDSANRIYPVGQYAYSEKYNGYWVCVSEDALAASQLSQTISPYYVAGYILSEVCLAILFVLRLRSKEVYNNALINCIAVLFAAFLLLILRYTIDMRSMKSICVMVGLLSQYTFLAYFFWLNVLAFLSLKSKKKSGNDRPKLKTFIKQSMYAWGVPLIITLFTFSRDFNEQKHQPNFATYCWLNDLFVEMAFFYLPIGILLLINAILFIMSVFKAREDETEENKESAGSHNLLPLKLTVILSFIWIFEIISWFQGDDKRYWLVFDLLNSLQGLFLLISICIADRRFKKNQKEQSQEIQPVFYKTSLPLNNDIKLNVNNP